MQGHLTVKKNERLSPQSVLNVIGPVAAAWLSMACLAKQCVTFKAEQNEFLQCFDTVDRNSIRPTSLASANLNSSA